MATNTSLKEQFRTYLANCVLTRRQTNDSFIIGKTAVDSYVSFTETDKLFDYAPDEWNNISSIFNIESSEKVLAIINKLFSDERFNVKDSGGSSQYYRSNAIKQYYCFLKAREIFFNTAYPSSQPQNKTLPLQQIYYGAPGTGKSHTINKITDAQPKENVFRTTFHPDSDYSTFVGCYKPTMKTRKSEGILSETDLTTKLKEIKVSGVSYPCHKFAAKYWESLKDLDATSIKKILTTCGFTDSMSVEILKGIAIGQEISSTSCDDKIIYSFVPQSFIKAYTRAWQTENPVYLVVEEINRGNCAQIFGDLFQLLDRKNGISEYPIKADNDLAQYLAEQFSNNSREDIPENVKSGEELMLPSNLHIWATMNTSDQSLFPIDSAFKRRWDWKYVPISNARKNWRIKVNGKQYDWWDFLQKINEKIGEATSSEDKKLGYFFCKADENGIISAEKFVGKVIFYLWNDVFKDFIEEGDNIFKGSDESKPSFNKFYTVGMDDDTMVVEEEISQFMTNLNLHPINDTSKNASDGNGNEDGDDEDNDDEDDDSTNSTDQKKRDKSKFSINQNGEFVKKHVPFEAVSIYVKNHPDSTAQDIVDAWKNLNARVTFVISSDDYETKSKESKDGNFENRYDAINLQNGEKIYVCNQVSFRSINDLMSKVNAQDWGIKIEKIDEQA